MSELLQALDTVIVEVVPDLAGKIDNPHLRLIDDLGIDSLSIIEIVYSLENRFDISVSNDELSKVETIQDLLDLVNQH